MSLAKECRVFTDWSFKKYLLKEPKNLFVVSNMNRCIFLYGDPVIGKSFTCKQIIKRILKNYWDYCLKKNKKESFYYISLSTETISSKWEGESEKNFAKALSSTCDINIIFIDEVNSILGQTSYHDDPHSRNTQFFQKFIDGDTKQLGPNTFIFATSNMEFDEQMPEAWVQRFGNRIKVLPAKTPEALLPVLNSIGSASVIISLVYCKFLSLQIGWIWTWV